MVWTQKVNLTGPEGPAGEEVTLQVTADHIQWKLGDGSWTDLIALADLTGPAGADGTSVNIVGSVANAAALPTDLDVGDAGDGYITLDDGHLHVWDGETFVDAGEIRGPQGEDGTPGTDGTDGVDGAAVSLRVNGGNIEWQHVGDGATWTTLVALSAITGPAGDDGSDGDPGTDGLRGTQIFNGSGAPGVVSGSAPGDMYLDTDTGIFWVLE